MTFSQTCTVKSTKDVCSYQFVNSNLNKELFNNKFELFPIKVKNKQMYLVLFDGLTY